MEKKFVQVSLTPECLDMLDEACRANGVSRSALCEMSIKKFFFGDEVTQQMRTRRKLPKSKGPK
jgi:hypothetical protein